MLFTDLCSFVALPPRNKPRTKDMEDMVTEPPAMEDVVIKLLAIEEKTRVRQESIIETITRKTMTVCMNVT